MWAGHFLLFSGSSFPIMHCRVWCTLSADPLVWGWYGVVWIFSMPSRLHIAAMTFPQNSVSWSDMRCWGKPNTVIVVQHLGCCPRRMVFGNKCLHKAGEVIYDHQHVPHYRLLVCCYGDFHSDVIDVDQFHWLGADDRLHRWELAVHFVLNTSPTVGYGFQQGLGHT